MWSTRSPYAASTALGLLRLARALQLPSLPRTFASAWQKLHHSQPPHKYGWCAEHLLALCKDADCGVALTDVIAVLAAGDVTDDTCYLLSSTTLVVLLNKTEEEMEALKLRQGQLYKQPPRPLGMGSTIPKIEANCILAKVQPSIGVSAGSHQFAVNAKGGCDMIQWIL